MKIAIIGVGFLGTKLINYFSKNCDVVGADINIHNNRFVKKLDATDRKEVKDFLISENPNIVIDTVALSSYFACENNPDLCKKLNYDSAVNIADICKEINAKMIFISSSYVFNGEKGNYSEKDIPNSAHEYGMSKVRAEKKVLELENSIIIRTEPLYGYDEEKAQITVGTNTFQDYAKVGYPDLLRSPVFVDDIPKIISNLIEKKQSGIFHIASANKIKWLFFLTKVASVINAQEKIMIVDNSDWILKPPHDSSLDISKITSLGISITSFDIALIALREIVATKKTKH
jgi:dTDP-4-dehydrorhamnose reductase